MDDVTDQNKADKRQVSDYKDFSASSKSEQKTTHILLFEKYLSTCEKVGVDCALSSDDLSVSDRSNEMSSFLVRRCSSTGYTHVNVPKQQRASSAPNKSVVSMASRATTCFSQFENQTREKQIDHLSIERRYKSQIAIALGQGQDVWL
jgi:hypothetical protein